MFPSRAISVDHTDGSFYSPARSPHLLPSKSKEPVMETVESSAFFLRDHHTGSEIIVFGDVEPDAVSLGTHNKRVWEAAAPKIATGKLRAIFIECSYNDGTDDSYLYGHMCPRHLVSELTALARRVMEVRDSNRGDKKRKREPADPLETGSEQAGRLSHLLSLVRFRESRWNFLRYLKWTSGMFCEVRTLRLGLILTLLWKD
ncbi:hypothetical protein DTO013F2_10642 [Penicillium roqueforti]|nr:hypothetical protein DTO013F2_10642 [Penicillium roqueforti]